MILLGIGGWDGEPHFNSQSTQLAVSDKRLDLFPEGIYDHLHPEQRHRLQCFFFEESIRETIVDLTPGCLPKHRG